MPPETGEKNARKNILSSNILQLHSFTNILKSNLLMYVLKYSSPLHINININVGFLYI